MDPTQMNSEQLANALWHSDDRDAAAVWCDDCLAAGQPDPERVTVWKSVLCPVYDSTFWLKSTQVQ